jgi:hypothetical protein
VTFSGTFSSTFIERETNRISETMNAAAPEGRPGGGSGNSAVNFPGTLTSHYSRISYPDFDSTAVRWQ